MTIIFLRDDPPHSGAGLFILTEGVMKSSTFPQHLKFDWLRFCITCRRHRDIESFKYPTDTKCAAQQRRIKRICESPGDYSAVQSSATNAGIRRRIKNRKSAEKAFVDYRAARRLQLLDAGVPPWEVWTALQDDLVAKREELRLPPP